MKRIKMWTMLLLAVITMGLVSSCSEDREVAITLSGEWEGDFGMYYTYGGRTYDSYDTYIVFYPDHEYAKKGYGIQEDYYKYGPYRRQYYRFYWRVSGGDIFLEYPRDPELNTVIRDYKISERRFTGYFGSSSSRFYLDKLSSPYDWRHCDDDYGYDMYPYYTRAEGEDSIAAEPIDESQIHRGNRFLDAAAEE